MAIPSALHLVGLALLLVVAVTALYGQFLWNPIIFDDVTPFLLDNQGNQLVSTYHFSFFELHSLPYATLAWSNECNSKNEK